MIDIAGKYHQAKYEHNLRDVLKIIQNLANKATKSTIDSDDSSFVQRNISRLHYFFDHIGIKSDTYFSSVPCSNDTITKWMNIVKLVGTEINSTEWNNIRSIVQSCDNMKTISPDFYNKVIEYYWIERSHNRIIPIPRSYSIDKFLSSSPDTQTKILTRGSSSPVLSRRSTSASSGVVGCSSSPTLYHLPL